MSTRSGLTTLEMSCNTVLGIVYVSITPSVASPVGISSGGHEVTLATGPEIEVVACTCVPVDAKIAAGGNADGSVRDWSLDYGDLLPTLGVTWLGL